MRGPARSSTVLLAAFFAAAGCDLFEPSPEPPITIELSKTHVELVAGLTGIGPSFQPASDPVAITIKRNGYSGQLTVTTELVGATSGPTLSVFVPDSVGVVSVSAPAGVAAGTYEARIRVATEGLGSRTATISVVVKSFAARVLQNSVVVSAGATNTISLDARPFGASVTFSVTAPPGITANVVTENSYPYLDVSGSTPGIYSLTVRASTGSASQQWPIQVTVQTAQPKTMVSFKLCRNWNGLGGGINAFYNTTVVAAANEGEAWTRLTADASGSYTFAATNRVSIAEVFSYGLGQYGPGTAVRVMQMTASELGSLNCSRKSGSRPLRTSVANATSYFISMGYARAHNATTGFGFFAGGVPLDMIASAAVSTASGKEFRSIVRRGVELADPDTVKVDFASGEAVVLDSAPLSVAGATSVPVTHVHAGTTIARLGGVNSTALDRFWGLFESQLAPGETQSVTVGTPTRGIVRYFRSVAPLSLSLGPEVAAPVADSQNLTIKLPRQPEYGDIAGAGQLTVRDNRGVYNYTEVWQTSGYAGTAGAEWTFTFPDLGRVHRVDPLTQGGALGAIAGSGPAKLFFGGTAAAGDEIRFARRGASAFGVFLPYPSGY